MLSRYFFQISERKFDRTRKHIRWICLRVIANLQLKFGEKTRNSFFIWHFAIQSITLNYEMLSRYFFQISERKFDRTRKHIRWICLRVIENLQLKFGKKTRNPFFYLAFCNSKQICRCHVFIASFSLTASGNLNYYFFLFFYTPFTHPYCGITNQKLSSINNNDRGF